MIFYGKKAKEGKKADAGMESLRDQRRRSNQEDWLMPEVRPWRFPIKTQGQEKLWPLRLY